MFFLLKLTVIHRWMKIDFQFILGFSCWSDGLRGAGPTAIISSRRSATPVGHSHWAPVYTSPPFRSSGRATAKGGPEGAVWSLQGCRAAGHPDRHSTNTHSFALSIDDAVYKMSEMIAISSRVQGDILDLVALFDKQPRKLKYFNDHI